jgi:GTP cyclohydrolase I
MANKDSELGFKIHNELKTLGIETPITLPFYDTTQKLRGIESAFIEIMTLLELDLKDDSLRDTPLRVAKMFVYEIFEGLNYENFPKCTTVANKFKCDEMVIVKGIDVSSTCEHHFQNISGSCKIAYIPEDKVLGLSKLNRVVRFFSKRPQIQERLTLQIYHALTIVLGTENVAVEIDAVHHCVCSRGIEDKASSTITRKLGGCFRNEAEARGEFLDS